MFCEYCCAAVCPDDVECHECGRPLRDVDEAPDPETPLDKLIGG